MAFAGSLADYLLGLGEVDECAAACEQGPEIDRSRNRLWRAPIVACERAEDRLATARARHRYREVLTDL